METFQLKLTPSDHSPSVSGPRSDVVLSIVNVLICLISDGFCIVFTDTCLNLLTG